MHIRAMAHPARFWAQVTITPSCWLWNGAINTYGYGIYGLRRKTFRAHRIAYELLIGPIPDGKQLDHVKARGCANRHCVNPAHLEPVTSQENNRRGDGFAGRRFRQTSCVHGHAYTPANTYISKDGCRRCRACNAAWQRRHEQLLREQRVHEEA